MESISKNRCIELNGNDLSIADVAVVARFEAKVTVSEVARKRVHNCRQLVETLVRKNIVAYGINTGFGALRNCIIPAEQVALLQKNLIRSHACGVGEPFPVEVVRAAILLRANTLVRGNSGVREIIIDRLIEMLDRGICPWIPCQGSVGASGDLSPLSHMALVLIGDPAGRFCVAPLCQVPASEFMPSTPENLQKYGFTPVELSYKEGLALNNGTQIMSALACLTLYDSLTILNTAEMAAALSLEACKGVATSLDERIHQARPVSHQDQVAKRLRGYIRGSAILSTPLNSAIIKRIVYQLAKLADRYSEELGDTSDALRNICE